MEEIEFRYNRYSETILYLMIILSLVVGFFIYAAIIYSSGILRSPEYVPIYFKEHKDYAIYFIFGLIPVCMLFPVWIAIRCWGSSEKKGKLHLYKNYAILYIDDKQIKINKGELKIKFMFPRLRWYVLYILKIPKRKIKLCTSVVEKRKTENKIFNLSLDVAMDKLMYYKKNGKGKKQKKYFVMFYELEIILGVSTAKIFDTSAYYVDYESVVVISEGEFVTCLIRDRKDPVHVVGDVEIDISLLNGKVFNEANLKEQPIIAVIELNEQVGL